MRDAPGRRNLKGESGPLGLQSCIGGLGTLSISEPGRMIMRTATLKSALILIILSLASFSAAQQTEYLLEIHDPPQSSIPTISKLDIWGVDPQTRTFTVAASERDLFLLDLQGVDYLVISTVDDYLASLPAPKSAPPGSLDFTDYHDMDAVYAFIDSLEQMNPDIVKQYDLGEAWQGDHVIAVKISDNVAENEQFEKGALFIGCHHAREWISVEVPLYLALYLVENYGTDPDITELVDNLEIWIIPCLNPDGYRYSWEGHRSWRKNRRPGGMWYDWGVDLNRNYSVGWGGEGSDGWAGSETYRGPYAFSEPETQYVKELVETHPNILAWISYHSYSQLILYPWGYIYDPPPDEDLFRSVGSVMREKIRSVHGVGYTLEQSCDLYIASGDSDDWGYGEHDIIAYTIELRPRGAPYFELPPEQIIPTCEENLPAALYLSQWVLVTEVRQPGDWLWPGWNWISVPVVPVDPTPDAFFGFDCSGILWRFDKYAKAPVVYQPPFSTFDLTVGDGYLLWLDQSPMGSGRCEGLSPMGAFEFRLGRQGWTWLGKPGLDSLAGDSFMSGVIVKYPSDETGEYRTPAQDRASGAPWVNWGWSWWDAEGQYPRAFTPYAPFGDTVCAPWRGYRAWVNVGTAMSDEQPDQVTLIWP
jgi:carboxypeptidase T